MAEEETVTTLESQISAYEEMRDVLETDYFGKWVVFHGGKLAGAYENDQDAAADAVRRFGRGPYLIRQVGAPPTILHVPVAVRHDDVRVTRELRQTYIERIAELRGYGLEDGISLNEASESDFWTFIESSGFIRRAGLVLMDNGNLRAVWKDKDSSHLALHFLGGQLIRYVIFKRRAGSRHTSRVAGTDTFEGIREQVQSFQLAELVKG